MSNTITRTALFAAVSYLALSADFSISAAYAQSTLPAVSVDAPGQVARRAPARRSGTGASRVARRITAPVRVEPVRYIVPTTSVMGGAPAAYAGGNVGSGSRVGLLGNQNYMDTPYSVLSVTSKTIEDRQARALEQLIYEDPSIRPGGANGINNFQIRGLRQQRGDQAFDGLFGLGNVYPQQLVGVERVEFLKGPAALLMGFPPGGSVGGVINVVPKRATDADINSLTAFYDSRTMFGTAVDIGRRFGESKEFGVRFGGIVRGGNSAIDREQQEIGSIRLGTDYRGDRFRVSFDLGYDDTTFKQRRNQFSLSPGVAVPTPPPTTINVQGPNEIQQSKYLFGVARGEFDITNNMTAGLAYGRSTGGQTYWAANHTITNVNGNTLAAGGGPFPDHVESGSLELYLKSKFSTGPIDHKVNITYNNIEYHYKFWFTGTGLTNYTSNIYNPVVTPYRIFDTPMPRYGNDAYFNSVGIADTMSILDGRIALTVGGRHQNIEVRSRDWDTGALSDSYDKSALTPSYALVVQPIKELAVYANYIEGLQQGASAPLTAANPGILLSPAVTKQKEVGAKLDLGNLGATIAYFDIELPSAYTDPTTNLFGLNGLQRNRGVEMFVFGEPIRGFRPLGGVTFMDAKYEQTLNGTNNGRKVFGIPDFYATLGAEVDVPWISGLSINGRVIHSDTQWVDAANTRSLPSWQRIDLGARYEFRGHWGQPVILRANVTNLLDKGYWETVPNNNAMVLGLPRTVSLSAQFKF